MGARCRPGTHAKVARRSAAVCSSTWASGPLKWPGKACRACASSTAAASASKDYSATQTISFTAPGNQTVGATVPALSAIPPGCAFNPRCGQAFARCHVERPELVAVGDRMVACHLYDEPRRSGAGAEIAA